MRKAVLGLAFILGCSSPETNEVVRHYENNWVNVHKTGEYGGFLLSDVTAKEAEKIREAIARRGIESEKGYFVFERSGPFTYTMCVSFPQDDSLTDRHNLIPAIRLYDLLKEAKLGFSRAY